MEFIPFKQKHGKAFSYGFRIGSFAYSTDVSFFSEENYNQLKGIKTWIIDCVRYWQSPPHLALDNTLEAIMRVQPQEAFLTHMCHDIDYDSISKILPHWIKPAYDGLKVVINNFY